MTQPMAAPHGVHGERYEILKELGRGGMGVVYACVDRVTGSRVALKRMERATAATADTFWFHQEARALASLDHPAIVRARDFGVLDDGSPYLVMDLVSGKSLHTLLEAGAPPWPLTWSIVDQVLAALAHAHARGVVHGDLKPQNLVIEISEREDAEPRAHVLDFGLAFLLRDRHDPRLDGSMPASVAMPYGGGTPGFMAPEQIRRAVPHVGPPTDLYALGCILYQMLTGRPPYYAVREGPNGTEQDEDALLRLHKSAPVPAPVLSSGVPAEVASMVVRLLAKRPWRRFDFAGDLRARWERVRPVGEFSELAQLEAQTGRYTVTPGDTRIDVPSAGVSASEPVRPLRRGSPELLGLRPTPVVGREHARAELLRLVELLARSDGPAHRMALLVGEAGVGKSRLAEWLCEQVHESAKMVPLRARYRRINGPLDGLNGAVLSHYGLERVDRILVEQALINTWEIEKGDEEGMTWVAATSEWLRPSSFASAETEPTVERPRRSESSRLRAVEILTNPSQREVSGRSEFLGEGAGGAAESKLRDSIPGERPVRERRSQARSPIGPTGKRFSLDEPELRWLVVRRALERIGRERPLLLWLDDFHLAPPRTFDGLAKIRREAPHLRMLIVATARTEALVGNPQMDRSLDALRRTFGGPRYAIGPLDPAETRALLRAALSLDDRALNEAEARSKGNPLFALQLLHAWAASGGLELVGGQYHVRDEALAGRATTTADLWDERLLALEPTHRVVAEAAAALGIEFRGDVLRRLVGFALGLGGFPADVARALDALQRAHILVALGEDRFRFPHALLQEHLLFRLAARPDAVELFRAAAEALGHHPLAGTRRVVRHRVLNLLRAGDGDHAALVLVDYVEQTWSRVRDASRTLEDLALLDIRPLDVASHRVAVAGSFLAPPPLSPLSAAAHLRWRAEALRHAGRFEEAREAAQKARKTFVSHGDERNEAHCLRLLGHIASEQGEPEEGRRFAARALTVFDRLGDDPGRASCEVVLGEIDFLTGEHGSARDALHRGARRFRAIGDALGRAQCLLLIGLIEMTEGILPKSRDLLAEARREFDGVGYRLGICQCDVAIAHAEHRARDFEGARKRALSAREALRALENPRGTASTDRLLAMIAIDQEDPAVAARHARQALDLYEKLGDPWGILESRLLLAQEALVRGDLEEARSELETCEGIEANEAEPQQHRHLTRAWLAAVTGELDRAAVAIGDAMAVFADPRRMADHSGQLLTRFDAMNWRDPAGTKIREWVEALAGPRSVTSTGPFGASSDRTAG